MQTAYLILSAVLVLAFLMFGIMVLVVEQMRKKKELGTKKYEFCLRLRNNELYLIGLVYPVKAIINLLLQNRVSIEISAALIWMLITLMVYRKYKFGIVPLEK